MVWGSGLVWVKGLGLEFRVLGFRVGDLGSRLRVHSASHAPPLPASFFPAKFCKLN